jgi:hypothetical protein
VTTPTAISHLSTATGARTAMEPVLARAEPADAPRPVHLGTLATRAIAGLVAGGARDLLGEYRGFAEALADPVAGDRTRRVDLARAIAVARAQQSTMDVLMAQALTRRDFEAAESFAKQGDRLARRIDSLLSQHRAEFAPRRPVIVVRAETANVLAVAGGAR